MSRRMTYTIKRKLDMIAIATDLLGVGRSQRSVAQELGIQPSQLRRWLRQEEELKKANNKQAMTVCKGGTSSIDSIEDELLKWIFELRETGMSLSFRMIVIKAGEHLPEFRRKAFWSKYQCVRRWALRHQWVIRCSTHETQRPPHEIVEEAKSFVLSIGPRLVSTFRHQRWILNMDQTPVFFSMTPNRTLAKKGQKTINVRKSSGSTIRLTAALCVSADGELLTPMIVFKGKPTGRINRSFPTYPQGAFYEAQEKAWMDEKVMLEWVEKVLKPHIAQAPAGVHPIILLDSYRCHMMESVVSAIQDLGCEVDHIPANCTGLCQPIDVGIGKPFKCRLRKMWEDWMMAVGVDQAVTKPPTREQMASWCVNAFTDLTPEIVKNSWRSTGFSYF
jgi:transposase-like protein